MGTMETIMSFLVVMTILMIPIIAIVRRTPKKTIAENAELARRVSALELKQLEREQELASVRKELSFMQRLIEEKAGRP